MKSLLDWKALLLIMQLLFVLAFLTIVSVTHGEFFEQYQRDVAHKEEHCNSSSNAKQNDYNKDCQSFFYRTVDDPVAFFTAGLFFFTLVLAVATAILIVVTLYGILQQGNSAERLFVIDQRPWVSIVFVDIGDFIAIHNRKCTVKISISISNIGKTPARNVFYRFQLIDATGKALSVEQLNQADAMLREGVQFQQTVTIFPNEKVFARYELAFDIKDEADVVVPAIVGTVQYKTIFDKVEHQTGIVRIILAKTPALSALKVAEHSVPTSDVDLLVMPEGRTD